MDQQIILQILISAPVNSIHKPPRPIGVRIEKVLPLPGGHVLLVQT